MHPLPLRPRRRRPLLAFSLLLALPACGKKGDPHPPLRHTPLPVVSVRLAQRGDKLEVTYVAPRTATDGTPLPVLDMDVFRADAPGDVEKVGVRRRRAAAPGETLVEISPLPPLETTVRVSVRATAKGRTSVKGALASLTVQPAPAPPTALTATLTEEGVALQWQGEKPVVRPKPTPSPAAPPPKGTPAPAGPARPAPPSPSPAPSPTPVPAAPPPANAPSPSPNPAAPPPPGPPSPAPSPSAPPTPPPFSGGFWVYRRPSEGAYAAPLFPLPVDAREYVDRTAPQDQTACYEVRAVASTDPVVESAGSTESCVLVKDITPPAPPEGLTALGREGLIELTWSPSPEADLASYRLYRSADDATPGLLATIPAGQTRYEDKSAAPGVRYRYTLTAVDTSGNESGSSNLAELGLP